MKFFDPNSRGSARIRSVKNYGTRYSKFYEYLIPDEKIHNEKTINSVYAKMCPFTIQDVKITHLKCVLICL